MSDDTFESVLMPWVASVLSGYHLLMFWKRARIGLRTAVFCGCSALTALAQMQLALVREIKLPVHSGHGTFGGGFLAVGFSADETFQFKVAPDQSLLIFYPNTSGKWPLIRVRNWWTATPQIEELDLPGWTEANTLKEFYFSSDLLITPNGHYAIALGGVASVKDAGNIPFPPRESIENQPDLLITAIDLDHWRIVGAVHTATLDPFAEYRGASIVNEGWLALQGLDEEPERVKYEHLYDRVNRLISIPDLKPGPGCITRSTEVKTLHLGKRIEEMGVLTKRDETGCAGLLAAAGVSSMRTLEWSIYLERDPEPKNLMVHTWPSISGDEWEKGKGQDSLDEVGPGGEYDAGYWTTNEWDMYINNPPFESSNRHWYQLRRPGKKPPYKLDRYTLSGQLLKEREAGLESNPQCSTRRGCVCTVTDVSEERGAILALCRVQSLNFAGGFDWHKQWLTVFRDDDFSQVGNVELTTNCTRTAIAGADGHTYVVAVDQGRVLRVFRVPER